MQRIFRTFAVKFHSTAKLGVPMFWDKNMAVVATDGNVNQSMIVFMTTLSFLTHACMELPSDNAGQYIVMPMMIAIKKLSLVVIVPDKQGYADKGYKELKGNDKYVMHNG